MYIIIAIVIYLLGIALMGYMEYKEDGEISYFIYISWMGVLGLALVYSVDKINKKIKK